MADKHGEICTNITVRYLLFSLNRVRRLHVTIMAKWYWPIRLRNCMALINLIMESHHVMRFCAQSIILQHSCHGWWHFCSLLLWAKEVGLCQIYMITLTLLPIASSLYYAETLLQQLLALKFLKPTDHPWSNLSVKMSTLKKNSFDFN